MDLESKSVDELKVIAYDTISYIESAQNYLREVNRILAAKKEVPTKKEEKKK